MLQSRPFKPLRRGHVEVVDSDPKAGPVRHGYRPLHRRTLRLDVGAVSLASRPEIHTELVLRIALEQGCLITYAHVLQVEPVFQGAVVQVGPFQGHVVEVPVEDNRLYHVKCIYIGIHAGVLVHVAFSRALEHLTLNFGALARIVPFAGNGQNLLTEALYSLHIYPLGQERGYRLDLDRDHSTRLGGPRRLRGDEPLAAGHVGNLDVDAVALCGLVHCGEGLACRRVKADVAVAGEVVPG